MGTPLKRHNRRNISSPYCEWKNNVQRFSAFFGDPCYTLPRLHRVGASMWHFVRAARELFIIIRNVNEICSTEARWLLIISEIHAKSEFCQTQAMLLKHRIYSYLGNNTYLNSRHASHYICNFNAICSIGAITDYLGGGMLRSSPNHRTLALRNDEEEQDNGYL